jgi:hypothetical protein
MDYDEEEYIYEEESAAAAYPQFIDEYNVFERVGGRMSDEKTVQEIAAEAGVLISARQGQIIRDAVHRFYIYVNASARRMISEGVIPWVTSAEVQKILTAIRHVKNPGYKNADAFVLGYAITRPTGNSINSKYFESIKPKLDKFEPNPLKQTDVVRYAHMWINIHNLL